jgi:hypothetical protein
VGGEDGEADEGGRRAGLTHTKTHKLFFTNNILINKLSSKINQVNHGQ